jgi:hypothetical protein
VQFRSARHTDNLETLIAFYTQVLGLEVLGEFKHHNGYDGVFIGLKNKDWHLEFTQTSGSAEHTFDDDDLLVFYPETQKEFDLVLQRIQTHTIPEIVAKNPYWNENGITVNDPDNYKVVISPLKIKK